MSADPNKKSARTFQCRDVLWETFEQMARELECSVDYLVNEAMKQYARQRSYGGSRTPYPGAGTDSQSGRAPVPPPAEVPAPLPSSGRPVWLTTFFTSGKVMTILRTWSAICTDLSREML